MTKDRTKEAIKGPNMTRSKFSSKKEERRKQPTENSEYKLGTSNTDHANWYKHFFFLGNIINIIVKYSHTVAFVNEPVTIYISNAKYEDINNQNSIPLFIWTEKEGRPKLERGASTLITTPELPTFPFHLDLPNCIRGIEKRSMSGEQ